VTDKYSTDTRTYRAIELSTPLPLTARMISLTVSPMRPTTARGETATNQDVVIAVAILTATAQRRRAEAWMLERRGDRINAHRDAQAAERVARLLRGMLAGRGP
jgi:hypothetical protein